MSQHKEKKIRLTAEEIKLLSKKSMIPWLYDALLDWFIIGSTILALSFFPNFFTILIALLVIGNRQHALTILGHEASHNTLSYSKKTNDLVSDLLAFWPIGLTTQGYRSLHMKHHKHTNTKEDPELAHRAARAPQWDLPMSHWKIIKYAASDLIGLSVKDYLIIIIFSKPEKLSTTISLITFHLSVIISFCFVGLWYVPTLWYISLLTSFMMFFRLRTFLEHLGTDETHRLKLNWWQRFLIAPHNIGYHWEHHNYPTIPYYNLKFVRIALKEVPVISLLDLLKFYNEAPKMASGIALKNTA